MDGPIGISNQQIASTIQTIVLELFSLFSRPLVLVTRVFFHEEFGERYFNEIQALLCLILIVGAAAVSVVTAGIMGAIIGAAWALGFCYLTWEHMSFTVPNRYKNGIRWHSRSDGVPRVPGLNRAIQGIVLVVAMVVMFLLQLHGMGLLLLLSLTMTIAADAAAARQFWNRVLDAVDGQIEGEELGKAIENRLTPAEAGGMRVSVPAHVSNDYRKRIAEALEGGAGTRPQNAKPVEPMPTHADAPAKLAPISEPAPTASA